MAMKISVSTAAMTHNKIKVMKISVSTAAMTHNKIKVKQVLKLFSE